MPSSAASENVSEAGIGHQSVSKALFRPQVTQWAVARWAAALMGLVFIVDVLTPSGIAVGMLYAAVVFVSFWSGRRWTVVMATAVCMALTVVTALFKPVAGNANLVMGNRLLSIVVLWALAFLILRLQASLYGSEGHPGSSLTIADGVASPPSPEEDRLRALSVHLQATHEGERRRLARDLHDHLGQGLTALKIDLSWLHQRVTGDQSMFSKIESMLGVVNDTLRNVRRLESTLRPAVLDDFGLAAALEWHIGQFEKRTAIPCQADLQEDVALDSKACIQVFRVFEEILATMSRQAVSAVSVGLKREGTSLVLRVQHTGVSLEEGDLPASQAIRLTSMRERLRPLGADLMWTTGTPACTTVLIRLPLNQ